MRPLWSSLRLDQLRFPVRLGWTEEERRTPQMVTIDLVVWFPSTPRATETDQLADAVDYAAIADRLAGLCGHGEYRLLERLTRAAYDTVRAMVPPAVGIEVTITKRPPLAGLEGGAAFTIGETAPPAVGRG